jgi:hypothetical protein
MPMVVPVPPLLSTETSRATRWFFFFGTELLGGCVLIRTEEDWTWQQL